MGQNESTPVQAHGPHIDNKLLSENRADTKGTDYAQAMYNEIENKVKPSSLNDEKFLQSSRPDSRARTKQDHSLNSYLSSRTRTNNGWIDFSNNFSDFGKDNRRQSENFDTSLIEEEIKNLQSNIACLEKVNEKTNIHVSKKEEKGSFIKNSTFSYTNSSKSQNTFEDYNVQLQALQSPPRRLADVNHFENLSTPNHHEVNHTANFKTSPVALPNYEHNDEVKILETGNSTFRKLDSARDNYSPTSKRGFILEEKLPLNYGHQISISSNPVSCSIIDSRREKMQDEEVRDFNKTIKLEEEHLGWIDVEIDNQLSKNPGFLINESQDITVTVTPHKSHPNRESDMALKDIQKCQDVGFKLKPIPVPNTQKNRYKDAPAQAVKSTSTLKRDPSKANLREERGSAEKNKAKPSMKKSVSRIAIALSEASAETEETLNSKNPSKTPTPLATPKPNAQENKNKIKSIINEEKLSLSSLKTPKSNRTEDFSMKTPIGSERPECSDRPGSCCSHCHHTLRTSETPQPVVYNPIYILPPGVNPQQFQQIQSGQFQMFTQQGIPVILNQMLYPQMQMMPGVSPNHGFPSVIPSPIPGANILPFNPQDTLGSTGPLFSAPNPEFLNTNGTAFDPKLNLIEQHAFNNTVDYKANTTKKEEKKTHMRKTSLNNVRTHVYGTIQTERSLSKGKSKETLKKDMSLSKFDLKAQTYRNISSRIDFKESSFGETSTQPSFNKTKSTFPTQENRTITCETPLLDDNSQIKEDIPSKTPNKVLSIKLKDVIQSQIPLINLLTDKVPEEEEEEAAFNAVCERKERPDETPQFKLTENISVDNLLAPKRQAEAKKLISKTPNKLKSSHPREATSPTIDFIANKENFSSGREMNQTLRSSTERKALKMTFSFNGSPDEKKRSTSQEDKPLAHFFQTRKKDLVSKLDEENKKFSTTDNAFRDVDKENLIKKRQEMMKYSPKPNEAKLLGSPKGFNEISNSENYNYNISAKSSVNQFQTSMVLQVQDENVTKSHLRKTSFTIDGKNTQVTLTTIKSSLSPTPGKSDRKNREPSTETLSRLAMGLKPNLSKKEIIESTARRYEKLPEVKQKRMEELKRLQWREDLKSRQSKVKELDQKVRRDLSAKRK